MSQIPTTPLSSSESASASPYKEYFDFALDLAEAAGKMINEAFHAPKLISFKDQVDLVTESDKAVEDMVMNRIKAKYPSHTFVAEESIAAGDFDEVLTDTPTWIIDPIDGTTNFVHKHPFACISIALAIDQVIVVGIVYNPMMEELFTAIQGEGAYRNGEAISVTKKDNLKHCLVGTGFPYDRSPENLALVLGRVSRVLTEVRDIRRAGSAALDVCYVAMGVLDIYYEAGVHAWDIAAGCLLLTEAGGVATGFKGEAKFDICNREVVATNAALLPQIVELIDA